MQRSNHRHGTCTRNLLSKKYSQQTRIFPHSNKQTTNATADQLRNYRMALNFLTEIALQAFRAVPNGIYSATTTPANCQENYSGDLKSKTSNNQDTMTLPPGQVPFSWPDLNMNKTRPFPNKQKQRPGPAKPPTDP